MAMHTPAFMTLRGFRQNLRCFKSKIFGQTRSHHSDSPLCRRPDELVHLKLKADVEPIGQNPARTKWHDSVWANRTGKRSPATIRNLRVSQSRISLHRAN